MNRQLLLQLLGGLALATLLLASCSGGQIESQASSSSAPPSLAPTIGLSQTSSAVSPYLQNRTLAKDKVPSKMLRGRVVYQLPDTDRVLLTNVPYKDKLTADIYYPPNVKLDTKLPVVIFVNGMGDMIVLPDSLKDTEQYISWGQLTAASGLIAVTYAARQPQEDTLDLINFVIRNSDQLGIDHTKIVLWSCSANTPVAIKLLTNLSAGYQEYLRGAVFYYGVMGGGADLPRNVRLFVMKGGKDTNVDNGQIDDFVAHARDLNIPVQLVEYPEGIHAFDVRQDTDQSRTIIKQTLDFMKQTLLNN